jgi:adenosylmethionine-8-amino-7-oxononanoate aminotransferase
VIFRNNSDILVIVPALIMTREQADEILEKAEEAISQAIKHFKL